MWTIVQMVQVMFKIVLNNELRNEYHFDQFNRFKSSQKHKIQVLIYDIRLSDTKVTLNILFCKWDIVKECHDDIECLILWIVWHWANIIVSVNKHQGVDEPSCTKGMKHFSSKRHWMEKMCNKAWFFFFTLLDNFSIKHQF